MHLRSFFVLFYFFLGSWFKDSETLLSFLFSFMIFVMLKFNLICLVLPQKMKIKLRAKKCWKNKSFYFAIWLWFLFWRVQRHSTLTTINQKFHLIRKIV